MLCFGIVTNKWSELVRRSVLFIRCWISVGRMLTPIYEWWFTTAVAYFRMPYAPFYDKKLWFILSQFTHEIYWFHSPAAVSIEFVAHNHIDFVDWVIHVKTVTPIAESWSMLSQPADLCYSVSWTKLIFTSRMYTVMLMPYLLCPPAASLIIYRFWFAHLIWFRCT